MSDCKLKHIAFIMDGNRRWAAKHKVSAISGHKKGAEILIEIAKAVRDSGIRYMTVYAFSTENWARPQEEVDGLMNLLRRYLAEGFQELQKENVRIIFIGERHMLASDITAEMAKIERQTKDNLELTLCVALSYGARQEIVSAVRRMAQEVKSGILEPKDIDMAKISDNLYTKDIPDPDLIVRTSGEQRLSNYLLWQSAYSELYFSETLWPDFSADELKQIVEMFNKRERRYGKS